MEAWMVKALAISSSLGFVVAMIARLLPEKWSPNRFVPKIGLITILLTNIGLLWNKFLESAGWATAQLGGGPTELFGVPIDAAGFWAFAKPILAGAQAIFFSFIQYYINSKWGHDGAVKPVLFNKEPLQVVLPVKSSESADAKVS